MNLIVPNVSWGLVNHECDLLSMSKSGYLTEIELKVSKSDLMNDFKKSHTHYDKKIKYFYYAVPEELKAVALEVIPKEAGLIIAYKARNGHIKADAIKSPIARPAKALSDKDQFQLARLGTMRIWSLKTKLLKYLK